MAKKEKEVKEKKQKSSYFKDMKAELKKVVWPTPKELFNNTVAVVAFVLIIAVIVFILDFCFDNLNKYGITKLQETVRSQFQTTEDSENTTSEDQSSEGEEGEDDSSNDVDAEVTVDGEDSGNVEATEETENTETTSEDTTTENSENQSNE